MSRYSGSSQERQCVKERYSDLLLLRVRGSDLLQDLFVCQE